MFEYHGQPYKKVGYSPPDWEATKARGEGGEFGGGLPQATFTENGTDHVLSQFGSIIRHFGIRYGYYNPKDYQKARYIDPVVETWGDVMGTMSKVLFAQDEAAKPALLEAYVALAKKYHGIMEKNLEAHGGKFAAGN